jgi:hypothetical protein
MWWKRIPCPCKKTQLEAYFVIPLRQWIGIENDVISFFISLFSSAIFLYLLLPQMLSKYLVTGAFEVIMDEGITVFSKLSAGRLPHMADLVEPLVKAGLVQI